MARSTTSRSLRSAAILGGLVLLAAAVATPSTASAATFQTNDTSPSIAYSSGWAYANHLVGNAFGDAHYSAAVGATATISFTGTSIQLIGTRNSDGGRSDVKVCDGSGSSCSGTTVIDFFATTPATLQTVFSAPGLSAGAHQLILTLRSDSSGSNHYSDVDAYIADNGASAIAGTRYIDNTAGCSNAGAGTSTSAPWCDFAPLQSQALAPGAQVLLKRGDSWSGPLLLTGSGTSSSWITLGAYGTPTDPRPIIHGSNAASDRTVVLQNPDYWHVQDLELNSAGEGLLVEYTSLDHHGLDIQRLYAHDLDGIFDGSPAQADYSDLQNSTAITVSAGGAPTPAPGQSVLTGLTVRNNTVQRAAGFYLLDDPTSSGAPAAPSSTFSGVNVSHNTFATSKAPILAFESAASPVLESNWVDCSGHQPEHQGTTCFFLAGVDSALIQNNAIMNMTDTRSADQTGIDLEYKIRNAQIRGNYFGHNAGAGIELLQFGREGDYNDGNVVEENDFYDNGDSVSGQPGQIVVAKDKLGPVNPVDPTVVIEHNDYEAAATGFITGGATSNVSSSDNTAVTNEYPSALQFSSLQGAGNWHEQSYSGFGSTWTDMPSYDSANARWAGASGSSVGAFVLTPGATSSQWVAREWIAPHAGTVSIRGRVFMDDTSGPGSSVLIERNSAVVWPATGTYATISGTDVAGVNSDVTLTVAAGDVIRFVVYGSSSASGTSWTPSVDYQ